MTFDLEFCLDSSSHIFKGVLVDEQGTIAIKEVIKGHFSLENFLLPSIAEINNYGEYAPQEKTGWEVFIFLTKNQEGSLIPVFNLLGPGDEAFMAALSILWVKKGFTYSAIQVDNPGPVQFTKLQSESKVRFYIDGFLNLEKRLLKINQSKRCKRKIKKLSKCYEDYTYDGQLSHKVYVEIVTSACGRRILPFLKPKIRKGQYGSFDRRMLVDYIKIGGERVASKVEEIYKYEFNFWKDHINSKVEKGWWKNTSKNNMRLAYFRDLMTSMAKNKIGNWAGNCDEVIDFFQGLPDYNESPIYEKIHDLLSNLCKG